MVAPKSHRVIVVDDEQDVRELVAELLERRGYEVRTCADGAEALKAMERGPLPDVMIIDLSMPRMNGWELIAAIDAQRERHPISFIVLTGDEPVVRASRDQRLRSPVVLSKPCDPALLLRTVEAFVKPSKAARPGR